MSCRAHHGQLASKERRLFVSLFFQHTHSRKECFRILRFPSIVVQSVKSFRFKAFTNSGGTVPLHARKQTNKQTLKQTSRHQVKRSLQQTSQFLEQKVSFFFLSFFSFSPPPPPPPPPPPLKTLSVIGTLISSFSSKSVCFFCFLVFFHVNLIFFIWFSNKNTTGYQKTMFLSQKKSNTQKSQEK